MEKPARKKTLIVSAGVLLRCEGKYLMVLPHREYKTTTTNGWGVPKGKLDENEVPICGALREFYEETGCNLEEIPGVLLATKPLITYEMDIDDKRRKKFIIYHAHTIRPELIKDFNFTCLTEAKPGVPEIGAYQWMTAEEAQTKCAYTQKQIFEKILNYEQN